VRYKTITIQDYHSGWPAARLLLPVDIRLCASDNSATNGPAHFSSPSHVVHIVHAPAYMLHPLTERQRSTGTSTWPITWLAKLQARDAQPVLRFCHIATDGAAAEPRKRATGNGATVPVYVEDAECRSRASPARGQRLAPFPLRASGGLSTIRYRAAVWYLAMISLDVPKSLSRYSITPFHFHI
jgi:hypothetical protein